MQPTTQQKELAAVTAKALTAASPLVINAVPESIVRPAQFAERLGIGLSTLYDWLAEPESAPVPLPRPRQVGPRAVGWPSSEVDAFIRGLPPTTALPRVRRKKPSEAATS